MKKPLALSAVVLLLAPWAWAQQVIENPAKPPAKNAGRVVNLERVLSIKGTAPDEPFRGPYNIQVGGEGSIYVYDNFELCKFSGQGQLLFKAVRSGQGPGEAQMRTVALVKGDETIVQAFSPPKVMWFDKTGKLLHELRTQDVQLYQYLFSAGGRIYGFREGDPPRGPDVKTGYVDVPTWLDEIDPDFGKQTAKMPFPVENYVVAGGGMWWQSLFLEYAAKDDRTLFISHTPEYRILRYDLGLNKIDRVFRRKYARIARPPEKAPARPAGAMAPPVRKYYIDIGTLLIHQGQLWVVTSTRDAAQNRLIDVYDMEGKYVDSFFLCYPRGTSHPYFSKSNTAVQGDRIYSIDEEEDGTMSVNVHRIRD